MAQVGPGRGVDRGERLVQQEHGRLDGEGPGQGDALGLPTRQLSRPTGRGGGQPDPFEPQCRGAPGFMLRYAATASPPTSRLTSRSSSPRPKPTDALRVTGSGSPAHRLVNSPIQRSRSPASTASDTVSSTNERASAVPLLPDSMSR